MQNRLNVLQIIPQLDAGGAEVGCLAIAKSLVVHGHHAVIATHNGRMIDQAKQFGVEIFSLPVHSKSPWKMWRNAKALKQFIRDHNIHLLHTRSRAPAWSAYWAAQATDIPCVSTYHGAYGQQNMLKRLYNGIMTKADTIIAPSQFIADHIIQYYPESRTKVQVIPRGIDLDQFQPPDQQALLAQKQAWGLHDNHRIILLPARFTRLKGHAVCIAAAQLIRPFLQAHQAKILFVGQANKPHYLAELRKAVEKARLNDIITFHDHCSQLQLAYAISSLVLACSTEPESFGRTAVEAQAMGCLVIATNHGGSRETVKNGETGWLIPPSDPDALAQSIKHALSISPDKAKSMRKEATAWARAQFDQAQMIAKTIAIYQNLLQT